MTDPIKYDQRPNGCYIACVAGLTGIPLELLDPLVPDDLPTNLSREQSRLLNNALTEQLRQFGWRVEHTYKDVPEGFAIGSGISPRGVDHAVIVRNGKLWHDPHPSRAGVEAFEDYEVLIPIIASGYFPVTKPTRLPVPAPTPERVQEWREELRVAMTEMNGGYHYVGEKWVTTISTLDELCALASQAAPTPQSGTPTLEEEAIKRARAWVRDFFQHTLTSSEAQRLSEGAIREIAFVKKWLLDEQGCDSIVRAALLANAGPTLKGRWQSDEDAELEAELITTNARLLTLLGEARSWLPDPKVTQVGTGLTMLGIRLAQRIDEELRELESGQEGDKE